MQTLEGYRMSNYNDVFRLKEAERHESVTWGKWPAARGGLTYKKMMATREGRDAYCVWNGIWRLVTRGKTGGECEYDGNPISAADIHLETNIPTKTVAVAFDYLVGIGWLENGQQTGVARSETVSQTDPSYLVLSSSEGGVGETPSEAEPIRKATIGIKAIGPRALLTAPKGFVLFWDQYPDGARRTDCDGAVKSWTKGGCEDDLEAVIDGLKRWKKSEDWNKDQGKYIPLIVTFLNQRRWESNPKRHDPDGHLPIELREKRLTPEQGTALLKSIGIVTGAAFNASKGAQ